MKTIDRYVLREIAVTAFFAVGVLSGVLVFGNLLRRVFDIILNHEIPLRYVWRIAECLLPFSLSFTLPWGFVTAVLLVFGRLSAENELFALRTSGVSLLRICAPVLCFAAAVSAGCVWLNATLVPRARLAMKKTVAEIAVRHPSALLTADQSIDQFPGQRIYVGGKKDRQLSNIQIFELDGAQQTSRVLFAKAGTVSSDPEEKKLVLRLATARVEDWSVPFDPEKIREGFRLARGDTEVWLDQLQAQELRRPPLSAMTTTRIFRYRDRIEAAPGIVTFEVSRRFSMSLAVITLTMVALPLAVAARRGEMAISFGLSVLVAFGYYLMILFADSYRDRPDAYPELMVWAANALFTGLGATSLWLLNRR